MSAEFQSWAALGVVAITALLFLTRALKRGGKSRCGGGCGCDLKPRQQPLQKPPGPPR